VVDVAVVGETRITVSRYEYMREVRQFREFKRLVGRPVIRGRQGILWTEWGRAMRLWQLTREVRWLEEVRRLRRRISEIIRREREARAIFRRKIIRPFWRIDVAYQFEEERDVPPYRFYLEVRKYVYTKTPEKYATWNERKLEYEIKPDVLEEFEGELRLILFASSLLSRVRKDGSIAHLPWIEAIINLRKFPFPNVEIAPVDESEVETPLDDQKYYFRVDETGEIPKREYDTKQIKGWLEELYRWVERRHKEGAIRYPKAFINAIKRTSLDDFIRRFSAREEVE